MGDNKMQWAAHIIPTNAYHFTADTLRDGSPIPPIGEELVFDGKPIMCQQGLHASENILDALIYAPGPKLHRVLCENITARQDDKLVCTRRTIVATIDATGLLREFSRMCALDVIDLWDAPDVVVTFLKTGDENLRGAAHDAVQYAVCGTSHDPTCEAAALAARGATSGSAARGAAGAAFHAERAAAHDAASSFAAFDTASEAAQERQRKRLTEMVAHAFKKEEKK